MMASHRQLLLVFACLLALSVLAEAGRKSNRKAWKKKKAGDGCKYSRTDDVTDCDPVTHTRNMTVTRKRGDADKCPDTKIVVKPCKRTPGCNYIRNGASWSTCDPATGRKLIELSIAEGQDAACPPTFVNSRPCNRPDKKKWSKKRGRKGRGRKNNKGKSKAERKAAKKAKRQQRRMNKASKAAGNN